jgi:hypothetical protein
MSVAEYFRELARRCRRLSKTASEPEVIEQMRVWTVDFADEAEQAERRDWKARMARRGRRGIAASGFVVN